VRRVAELGSLGVTAHMARRKFKVGDKIRVIGYQPGVYPPGVVDDMDTEQLFQGMVGRRYTIRGFDDYGHIELQPKRLHTVWIEPGLVKLVRSSRFRA
jgi:hypothetical protein